MYASRRSATAAPVLSRRDFLATAAACAAGAGLAACHDSTGPDPNASAITARPGTPSGTLGPGFHDLGTETVRDGYVYVPAGYTPAVAAPLVVLLHGGGRSAQQWSLSGNLPVLADPRGVIVVAPSSRFTTWDLVDAGYAHDVITIDKALERVFRDCHVDPARIALGGFSDGASYALSLGISNGDLFSALLGFSPGFLDPDPARGKPRIFVAHGTEDTVISAEASRSYIVPSLRSNGYAVEYVEFAGRHVVPLAVAEQGFEWFVPKMVAGASAGSRIATTS